MSCWIQQIIYNLNEQKLMLKKQEPVCYRHMTRSTCSDSHIAWCATRKMKVPRNNSGVIWGGRGGRETYCREFNSRKCSLLVKVFRPSSYRSIKFCTASKGYHSQLLGYISRTMIASIMIETKSPEHSSWSSNSKYSSIQIMHENQFLEIIISCKQQ